MTGKPEVDVNCRKQAFTQACVVCSPIFDLKAAEKGVNECSRDFSTVIC
jgi:hypothetical protein